MSGQVLLIDAQQPDADFYSKALGFRGFAVKTTKNADEALKHLKRRPVPRVDWVVQGVTRRLLTPTARGGHKLFAPDLAPFNNLRQVLPETPWIVLTQTPEPDLERQLNEMPHPPLCVRDKVQFGPDDLSNFIAGGGRDLPLPSDSTGNSGLNAPDSTQQIDAPTGADDSPQTMAKESPQRKEQVGMRQAVFSQLVDEVAGIYNQLLESGEHRRTDAPRDLMAAVWTFLCLLRVLSATDRSLLSRLTVEDQFTAVTSCQPFIWHERVIAFLREVGRDRKTDAAVREAARALLQLSPEGRMAGSRQDSLVWFTGKIDRIDQEEKVAFATLFDEDRQDYDAEFETEKVEKSGLVDGDNFFCIMRGNGDTTAVTLVRRPKKVLTQQKLAEIRRAVAEVFAELPDDADEKLPQPRRRE
jgi:hypothetical protein